MMNKGVSKYKREKILMHFCEDIEASRTARLTGINRNTVNRYYNIFREHILSWQYREVMELLGEIEVDESYFGARRIRGKRGRGAAGKTPVFGLLKRGGKVFVTVVASVSKAAFFFRYMVACRIERLKPGLRFDRSSQKIGIYS